MTDRRGYLTALASIAGGAGLALLASVPTWLTATVVTPGLGTSTFAISGSQAAVGLVAMALVALAGTVAVLATNGRVRTVLGVLVALAGCAVVALAAVPGLRPLESARGPVLAEGGNLGAAVVVHGSPWWLLAVLGGLLVVYGGVATVRGGRSWATMSARYERGSGAGRGGGQDPWSALDRGEDPTLDPGAPATEPDLPE